MIEEFAYQLESDVDVMVQGKMQAVNTVTLKAPTAAVMNSIIKVSSEIKRALVVSEERAVNQRAAQGTTGPPEESGEEVTEADKLLRMQVMLDFGGANFQILAEGLRDVFCNGYAALQGEPMTNTVFERFTIRDVEGLLLAYITNFLTPSWMNADGRT